MSCARVRRCLQSLKLKRSRLTGTLLIKNLRHMHGQYNAMQCPWPAEPRQGFEDLKDMCYGTQFLSGWVFPAQWLSGTETQASKRGDGGGDLETIALNRLSEPSNSVCTAV